jgi:hypothetical protein
MRPSRTLNQHPSLDIPWLTCDMPAPLRGQSYIDVMPRAAPSGDEKGVVLNVLDTVGEMRSKNLGAMSPVHRRTLAALEHHRMSPPNTGEDEG